ncbi:MAG: sigma-70 family RNA polymerase sigma factor [Lachnospiraceae bacterium]|jgi:RNA polymerase sigma-70 factor (ECF subfamily)|nr:sigma-70 family RNA polymerase sigma factor [Lachnospiraceae bacterium]
MVTETENTVYDIGTLMREYGNDVLRTAYSFVRDKEAAKDLFQETFIKANYNLDKFRGESSVKTWLIRITVNVCKDYLKSAYQKKVVPMTQVEEDSLRVEDDYEQIENEDRDEQIRRAVNSLPEIYREVVLCVYFKEMSVADASASLGVPEGTVKSRLARAREVLKSKLEGRL